MKKLQNQIDVISKNLIALAEKLGKIKSQLAEAAPVEKKVTAAKKKVAKAKKKEVAPKKAAAVKTVEASDTEKNTVLDSVMEVIKKSKNGATIASLKAKTNLESRQLSNALYKLSKKGQIKTISRGVYVKA
jgi:predicted Rossmann fold nucleotide-binding protein DprA/Smf involved in DNA uptake